MVKSKKPKKPVNLKPEYVLDPKAEQIHRKKKKHAPDRPQPEWMFPPAEENPVLTPKAKSQERQEKEKRDHDHAIKFLKYKSVSTPLRAPPPAFLLTLVGSFLTSYGFNSTSRLYTTELASRKKLDEWEVLLDQKLPKGFPDLVKLFKVGQKTYNEEERLRETSSSDENNDNDTKADTKSKRKKKVVQVAAAEEEETSSSGSDDGSDAEDSDEKMEEATPITKSASRSVDRAKRSGSSSSSSSSDSDADDEEEAARPPLFKPKSPQIENGLANATKRTAVPIVETPAKAEVRGRGGTGAVQLSSEEETSSEESESEDSEAAGEVDAAGSKPKVPTTAPLLDSESDSTSTSSESECVPSTSSTAMPINPTAVSSINTSTNGKGRTGSSSSETLQGTTTDQKTTTPGTSLSSSVVSSEPNSSGPAHDEPQAATGQISTLKRKHEDQDAMPVSQKQQKKTNAPFERVPKGTPVDDRFTNKYKSYDYADRAYQDLSVTKGKGFTKEKNKKKRGSYRGGAIDIGGGKGVKFED